MTGHRCGFVPPYLIAHVDAASLDIDDQLRARRAAASAGVLPHAVEPATGEGGWTVHDAHRGSALPGTPVRSAGDPASGDVAVDEAYAGVEASLALLREAFGRASYDDQDARVLATVHYQQDYDNAFWDGSQLVFGDGDGVIFERFTKSVDVLGHELAHAVTQYAAGLVYEGQSGALNESVSDVFAAMVKQRLLGHDAAQADWLIGAELFRPGIAARGLRDMVNPGTAYDDPRLGRDPQPASMADYVETTDDNGGVHINSGIPNRAFAEAAKAVGGPSWETVGPVWYAALTSGLDPRVDFAGFAAATVAAAEGTAPETAEAVRTAWRTVGLGEEPASAPQESAPEEPARAVPARVVSVRRSGGFAGMVQSGHAVLGDDPRTPEIESLLVGFDPAALDPQPPQPDRFVYSFDIEGRHVTVPEQALTPELEQLAGILLDAERGLGAR